MNNKETSTELTENNKHTKMFLPNKLLECVPKCTALPKERQRWNTNKEIASYLITFDKHEEWLSCSLKTRPQNGSIIVYNRKKVKYRNDGYCWKKRKDGKTTREDHMKLKVQGMECLYGCYVHSSIVPTFHRRCYWLLQNPDIVLVHYLNVPASEDGCKVCGPILCSSSSDRREWLKWSKEELICQLRPMFHGVKWTCGNGIEQLVQQILESHQAKPQPRTHTCLCSGDLGTPGNIPHKCNSTKHRIISPKVEEVRPCPSYPALTEVQNLSTGEPVPDTDQGGGEEGGGGGGGGGGEKRKPTTQQQRQQQHKPLPHREGGKALGARMSPGLSSAGEGSPLSYSSSQSSFSSSQSSFAGSPDSAQNSPSTGALGNGHYGDQRVPVAAVTGSLPQNAVIVMTTGLGGGRGGGMVDNNGLTPSQQLIAKANTVAAVSTSAPISHSATQLPPHPELGPPRAAPVILALVPGSVSGLMLSDTLDASMEVTDSGPAPAVPAPASVGTPPPAPAAFDPDSFLNSPRQGQTYGGAANQDSLSVSFCSLASSRSPGVVSLGEREREEERERRGGELSHHPACSFTPAAGTAPTPTANSNRIAHVDTNGNGAAPSLSAVARISPHCVVADSATPKTLSSPVCVSLFPSPPHPASPSSNSTSTYTSSLAAQTFPSVPLSRVSLGPSSLVVVATAAIPSGLSLAEKMGCLSDNRRGKSSQPPVKGNRFFIQDDDAAAGEIGVGGTHPARHRKRSSPIDIKNRIQDCCSSAEEEKQNPALTFRAGSTEGETPMDTNADPGRPRELEGEAGGRGQLEGHSPPPPSSSSSSSSSSLSSCSASAGAGASEPRGNNETVSDLYSIIQRSLGPATAEPSGAGTGLGLGMEEEQFEISFDNQFPDLISEFISEDEGRRMGGELSFCTSIPPPPPPPAPSCGTTVQPLPLSLPNPLPHSQPFPIMISSPPACVTTPTLAGTAVPGLAAGGSYHLSPQLQQISPPHFLPYPELAAGAPSPPAGGMEARQPVTITDFSPEWSYPEGGVKVLITGPWMAGSERYSCLFDHITVPASLIQSGVLRCYCPAHEAGLVTLQVAQENHIISSSVLFEYRARNSKTLPSTQIDWLSLDDNQFRMSILERLEQMEKRMAEMTASNQQQQQTPQHQQAGPGEKTHLQAADSFEERIMAVCEKMMTRPCWLRSERLVHETSFRGMTLLHLAAAQGYGRLIETLIRWRYPRNLPPPPPPTAPSAGHTACTRRSVNPESLDLEQEVDPLNVDHFSCTPLMWACALGHLEAAVLLYQWDRLALAIPDSLGRLPLCVARSRGHVGLASCLEDLERQELRAREEEPGDWRQRSGQGPAWPDTEGGIGSSGSTGAEGGWLHWAGHHPEGARVPSPLSTSPDTGLSTSSSPPSPSDLSSAPPSLSSAYSSSSFPRESPSGSPDSNPSPTEQEVAMEISEPGRGFEQGKSLPTDSLQDAGGDRERREQPPPHLPAWYLQEEQASLRTRASSLHCGPAEASFLMEYEASLIGRGRGPPRGFGDPLEAELLSYSENAENEECLPAGDVLQVDMITLAEQIIKATPDRIKQDDFGSAETPLKERQDNTPVREGMPWLASYLENMEQLPALSQHRSVCSAPLPVPPPPPPPPPPAPSNPCLSPVHSPLSDLAFDKVDVPTTADWSEFLSASAGVKMESEFALLTLSDHEQRELYEAARIIQTAFRKYKGRRLKEQQEMAAAVIQRCYRKYKQYALYKKMTQAAILIQSKFRSYYEQKKFQQSRRAAVLIQQYYRSYKYERMKQGPRAGGSMQQKMKGSFLTKKQDQAARKIMRFLRRCRHRIKELKQSKELEGL
ncbi:calmodulin-binding transcription activator 2-like isoform X2 [Acipenser ruthenus]|uniref:calmodulin-binding transcription activator 2-like isoform X2 n=1 Tax=Acipenser ruthenus TaxID=7906 RepID=UPI002741B8F3|nr:calmodulin-binding transcription activator 2-like isoform X2 [Acipenser ruthenus]